MRFLRGFVVFFLAIGLCLGLFGAAVGINFHENLRTPPKLESWVNAAVSYNGVLQSVAANVPHTATVSIDGNPTTFYVTTAMIQQALLSVYPSTMLHANLDQFIASNYDWLEEKTATPNFKLNLENTQAEFVTAISSRLISSVAQLPSCSPRELLESGSHYSLSTAQCLPPNLPIASLENQLQATVNSDLPLLHNLTITAASLNRGTPYYKQASWAPTAYHVGTLLPWLGTIVSLVCVGLTLLVARVRRGSYVIATSFLLVGTVLLIVRFLTAWSVQKVEKAVTTHIAASETQQTLLRSAGTAIKALTSADLWIGSSYLLIALLLLIVTHFLHQQRGSHQRSGRIGLSNLQ